MWKLRMQTRNYLLMVQISKPLNIVKVFGTDIPFEDRKQRTCVPLLGKDTATRLGLLKVDPTASVNLVESKLEGVLRKYEDCFTCLGKLHDLQLKVHVDPSLNLVIHPVIRLPFSLHASSC
jgi:hypothetical protein